MQTIILYDYLSGFVQPNGSWTQISGGIIVDSNLSGATTAYVTISSTTPYDVYVYQYTYTTTDGITIDETVTIDLKECCSDDCAVDLTMPMSNGGPQYQCSSMLDTIFTDWVNEFSISANCSYILEININSPIIMWTGVPIIYSGATDVISGIGSDYNINNCGGNIYFDVTITDECGAILNEQSILQIDFPQILTANIPSDESIGDCATQPEIDDAFDTWLSAFTYNGGCNVMEPDLFSLYTAPTGSGESVMVTYSISDACGQSSDGSSTFTLGIVSGVSEPLDVQYVLNDNLSCGGTAHGLYLINPNPLLASFPCQHQSVEYVDIWIETTSGYELVASNFNTGSPYGTPIGCFINLPNPGTVYVNQVGASPPFPNSDTIVIGVSTEYIFP